MSILFTDYVILGYLFIFMSRILDVSCATLRMILVVRGERLKAACIGFFEVMLYVFVLNVIFDNLDNIGNLLAYALGFATGNYVGGYVEEKLAIGIQQFQVITNKEPLLLAEALRGKGYGVTVLEGSGRTGPKYVLQALLERKQAKTFSKTVADWDPDVFMIISDAKKYRGGFVGKGSSAGAIHAGKGK